jgi:predicted GIY-YIG superfamily endonuclease
MSIYYNYILYQPSSSSSSTYNGYTTNIEKRLRQHNGELSGGAKATTRKVSRGGGTWSFLAIVTSPSWYANDAMKFEWNLRYPTQKKPRPSIYQGKHGRIHGLLFVLLHSSKHIDDLLFVHVHQDFLEECVKALATMPNVHVYPLEPFLQTQTQTQTKPHL